MLIVGALLLAGCTGRAPQPRTQVILLGTGTPNPDPDRSGPAVAVVVSGRSYLVDAGPGMVRRAAAAAKDGVPALAMPELRRVFITHLHSDHTLGLPDLIFTPWVIDREVPLQAFGPPGLEKMVARLLEAWEEDIDIRTHDLQPHTERGYEVVVTETVGGEIYRDSLVTVTAIRVDHGAWPVALAYRFVTPDGVILISGDARYSPALEAAAAGVDILVHEVISAVGLANRSPEWQAYHSTYHTQADELARLAAAAQPGLLVLYHQLFSGVTEAALLEEITGHYEGTVVSGRDLDRFSLPLPGP